MNCSLRILALQPYHAGSHAAFLDGWREQSRHQWTVLSLPGHHWKWRMRHASVTFAEDLAIRADDGERWDALFCTSMLPLAEFRGLAPPAVRVLPAVMYFHENQLTYPMQPGEWRDVQFGLSQLVASRAATAVWFNSAFHREEFRAAARDLLAKMPAPRLPGLLAALDTRSAVQPPGVDEVPLRTRRTPGPMRIGWLGRWEHDKNPEQFFSAMDQLASRGVAFRLVVLGEQFRDVPAVFKQARRRFADCIDVWGYRASREEYLTALGDCDVAVSTARHEFFGLGMVEAALAGARLVLPNRLAYPEIFAGRDELFYDGTTEELVAMLTQFAAELSDGRDWNRAALRRSGGAERYRWTDRAAALDDALVAVASK